MRDNGHGGDIYSHPVQYDFSANINPLGMPPSVKQALIDAIDRCEHYPDIRCTELKQALAEREQTTPGQIACGNGAIDLIYRIAYALKPRKALLPAPTFSEYEAALESIGCRVEHLLLQESEQFQLTDAILDRLRDIDIVFLCSPNNPVGNTIEPSLMHRIIRQCDQQDILLVVDECFMDFVQDSQRYRTKAEQHHLIVLKAFTKIYAMAGLRLGYMVCGDEALCRQIERCGPCWNVSVPAQIAGVAALKEQGFAERSAAFVACERQFLMAGLRQCGCKVYPSEANFILFRCELPLDTLLMQEQIAIRNCSHYMGLKEGFFRIAVRTHEENTRLLQALERSIASWQKPS